MYTKVYNNEGDPLMFDFLLEGAFVPFTLSLALLFLSGGFSCRD